MLECTNNKYYVIRTTRNVNFRFEEHQNGFGVEWTRKYKLLRIIKSDDINLELNKTLSI